MVNVTRRSFLELSGGAAAVAAGLGLAGCGNSNSGSGNNNGAQNTGAEPQSGSPATTPLDQLPLPEKDKTYNNPQPRDNIQQGGTLTLPAGEVGPNWNVFSTEGNTATMQELWSWYMPSTITTDATITAYTPDPNFITSLSSSMDSGKEVVTVDFNENAHFNDGTPIDYRALQAVWTVCNGTNDAYTPASTDGYDKVESIEPGSSDKEAILTFSDPVYPYEPIVSSLLHPDAANPDAWNSWNNNPHPEWGAGPFTVDSVDNTQVTFKPNPEWWGDAPMLDTVQYKQMDAQATYNAFKNGEVDTTGFAASGSQEMLSNFEGMDDTTIRRGNSLGIACIEVNTEHGMLQDINVRKAFWQCIDPATIRSVIWQGVNWDEDTPGSLLVPYWADGYEDNRPDDIKNLNSAEDRTNAAKQTLEDAGYTQNDSGIYEKDGQPVTFGFTTFGDSNTVKNRSAAIQKMAKDAGMDVEIDSHPSSDFSKVLASGNWDVCLFRWVSVPAYVWNAPQLYGSTSASNFTHTGDADLDKELEKIITISDKGDQRKAFNDAEKKCMQSYAFIPLFSGPDVIVTKAKLANWGPALFESTDYKNVGFQK